MPPLKPSIKKTANNRSLYTRVALLSAGISISVVLLGIFFIVGYIGSNTWDITRQANEGSLTRNELKTRLRQLRAEEEITISVVESLSPSVVSVRVEKRHKDLNEDDLFWQFGETPPSDPLLRAEWDQGLVEIGGGTGFFVTKDGWIATNRHVVQDPEAVYSIVTHDGAVLPATLLAQDPILDIALLDVEGYSYSPVSLGSSNDLRIGQTVIAIGNTLSEFQNTVTKGVISGLNRKVVASDEFGAGEVLEHAIQTDAAINPGNSGGPLIDLVGRVIGMNTATSFEGQSIGFAILINDVQKAVNDVKKYGRIRHPWLGVRYIALDKETGTEQGLVFDHGAYLVGDENTPAVLKDSPAEVAGLQTKDVILAVNGQELSSDHPLGEVLSTLQPDNIIELKIGRGEEVFFLSVTLGEFPQQ